MSAVKVTGWPPTSVVVRYATFSVISTSSNTGSR
jgi:hypothetical protein